MAEYAIIRYRILKYGILSVREVSKVRTIFDHIQEKRERRLYVALFPLIICYYETVFKLSTMGGFWSLGTVFTLLFSLCGGGICYLLTTLSSNRKVNRGIAIGLMAVLAVLYLVQYFIYREFKIFYDINTVFGGAGDVAGDYMGSVFELIFNVKGIITILLFAFPTVLSCIFGGRLLPIHPAKAAARILTAVITVVLLTGSILTVGLTPLGTKYRKEYTFHDAVSNFGLLTGLRLDMQYLIFGGDHSGFSDTSDIPVDPTQEEPEPTVVEYGENKLDINFTALAASSSGKVAELDKYVASLKPSKKNKYTGLFKGKNLIMISAEAFSAEVIDPELTPTLYRLATKGINFTDFYQPASAGTTGGEYQNLLGLFPSAGGMSFKNSVGHDLHFSMGNQLKGYYGKAFHNNTYTYYSRNKTHTCLGYSDGYMGYGNGMEQYVQNSWPQSDLEMLQGTLPTYIDKQPFNVYYMSVSGHGNYGKGANSMSDKNFDAVQGLTCSDTVKRYLAANLELEKALAYTVETLESKGIADDTVICICADHFPYGLDADTSLGKMTYLSELYGYSVTNYIQRDHNRLILWSGCLEKEDPIVVSSPTFSLDIVPTLSNLFGTDFDSRLLPGRDVLSDAEALIFNGNYDWKTDYGTYISATGTFTPASDSTTIPDGYVDKIRSVVANKMKYCADVLETDYYRHVFNGK